MSQISKKYSKASDNSDPEDHKTHTEDDAIKQKPPRAKLATFSALSNRNYRLYFIGQVVSNSGTWMQMIAQSWLVLQLSKSGVVLGLVSAANFLPTLLLGPLAGVYVDRANKRKLLIGTQSAFALLALALGLLVEFRLVQLWMIFVAAALVGLVNTLDMPARQTFVIEMVGPKDLPNAVSLNSVVMNSARVIGPSIAGAVIYSLGVGPNFILNAISFLAVIAMLIMLRTSELMPATRATSKSGQLREGFSYVAKTPSLAIPLLMMVIVGTLAYEFQVSLPLFTTDTFHLGAGSYALITASLGLGAVVGGLGAATYAKVSQKLLVAATLAFGVLMILMSEMPSFPLALIATALTGAASIVFLSTANSLLQMTSLPEMRGRVMSLYGVAFLGSTPIGAPLIGYISGHFGGRSGILVGGVATLTAGLLAVIYHRHKANATRI
ncbi:MFS transporter [Acidithrix sp. C25]|uniref:MFS transporter n=1 Tax=Acidithrix sp. C25 TaxID=1671482 RepID=UPI00191BB018|nr:MFS transporter [Acidithrix sp. C25]CAG4919031.1 unnamed protein product [Acidithrix sp. C25]